MAMKRCPICGEKFSDTYRDCPFCEEEDALRDGEEIRRYPRKGNRVAHGRQFNIITPTLIVLILIMAALLVYLLYGDKIAEKLGKEDEPSKAPVEDILEDPTQEEDPSAGTMPEETDDPVVELPLETDYELTMKLPSGISLSTTDFSLLKTGESHTIKVTGGGNGTYSWVSQDEGIASVDENGKVVAVSNGTVNVVVTDGSKKGVCIVRVRVSGSTATQNPSTTEEPAPSSGLKAGKAKVINAGNGVRVRSGPGTNYDILATLNNGATVQVVESAGNSWYKITFSGMGGVTTPGYMMDEFLQNS